MKILFTDKQEKSAAGMGTYSNETIRYLTKKGQTVIPLRYGHSLTKTDPQSTILLPYLVGNKSTYFIPNQKTLQLLRETIKKNSPDVIHLSLAISPLDFYIPKLAHQLNIPVVGILHGGFPPTKKTSWATLGMKSLFLSYLPCLLQLDKIIVFSETVADFLKGKKVKANKIVIIPNSVDTRLYSPGGSIFKNKNKIKFAFLFLGRLDRQKNPDMLIESFLSLNPPAEQKLILVGEGTIGSLGEEIIQKYKKHPQIIFTGPKTDIKEKIDIIRSADVFVQPSSFEGMSFSLLEAMSCGLAPISTDAGNHTEVIADSGPVISHNKIEEQLPIALQLFSKNPFLAKILGRKARTIILQKYNLEKNINSLLKIYQEVINSRRKIIPQPPFLKRFLKC